MDTATRERLLAAAEAIFDESGASGVTMGGVAARAEVSRQAVYLHFEDRAALLVALVERIDRGADLERAIEHVFSAKTAALAIKRWAEMQAERNPRIAALARALDAQRHEDGAATAAWRDRTANRMRGARHIVDRLAEEGGLDRRWNREEAAVLLWELTSFRVWDDLVNEAGLSPEAYVRLVSTSALAALAPRVSGGRR
jgi:AcrR family transcriptional regulator